MAERKKVRFGLIGLGLMGKEFASAVARWCHLLDDGPVPVITAICNQTSPVDLKDRAWFTSNFDSIALVTSDYHELLASKEVDAVYCAVPHHLHRKFYIDILAAGKHLLGEKPFGIDLAANDAIVAEAAKHPELVVRSSSEFPYYPGSKRLITWLRNRGFGRLIEVRAGFHHSSDLDLTKKINWKRMIEYNGEYGSMGDLGFHTHHIPLRMGWYPKNVFADLLNIATERPDDSGKLVPCLTWDNATLTCRAADATDGSEFSLTLETKRMAPGATNTWFIEVYGTESSAKFSTHDPRSISFLETSGKEQGWTRTDIGADFWVPSITGPIFETGFSDALQQMLVAFLSEFSEGGSKHPFRCGSLAETAMSHRILTAALESDRTGRRVELPSCSS
jgi:predicted dehydrogenase